MVDDIGQGDTLNTTDERHTDYGRGNSADISPCEEYRYELRRHLGGSGLLVWVMLNPSTADAEVDDPTIRRVMGFTKREDIGLAVVVNLFALRSPSPKALRSHADPVGPENDTMLKIWGDQGWPIVCAWGAGGGKRAYDVLAGPLKGANLFCLGTTKGGLPRHPLYVRGDQPFIKYHPALIDGPGVGAPGAERAEPGGFAPGQPTATHRRERGHMNPMSEKWLTARREDRHRFHAVIGHSLVPLDGIVTVDPIDGGRS